MNKKSEKGVTSIEYALAIALIIAGLLVFREILVASVQGYYDHRKDGLNYINKTPLVTTS